jgi:O-antigen ligase
VAKKKTPPPAESKWPFRIAATGFFLAEIVVLRGAASPFRVPKDAIVLTALSFAVGLFVAVSARRKTLTFPRGKLTTTLIVLPVLLAVSSLWSASPSRSLESAAFSLVWVLGILWLATLDTRSRLKLATITALGVLGSASVMVLQRFGLQVFDLGTRFSGGRLSLTGLTGNPADLAMAAVLILPLFLMTREGSERTRFQVFLIIALSLATLLTRTLSGLGSLVFLFLVWLVQQKSRSMWTRVAVIGAIIFSVALAAGLGSRLESALVKAQRGDWYHLFSDRGDGWSAASEMIRARPISGVGAANFDHLYYPSRLAWFERHGGIGKRGELASHFNWAHSDPLQMVAELGVIAVFWMASLILALAAARSRAGPLIALAGAACGPLALFHYPTHLAVALIPIALVLGEIISTAEKVEEVNWFKVRAPIAIIVMFGAIVFAGWQLKRIAADLWVGGVNAILHTAQRAPSDIRSRQAAAIEAAVITRIDGTPRYAPTLWGSVGRARMMRRDYRGAETAFRTAYAGWPHEDADFQLGLTLVSQGRRSEGLQHLGRVCRTNPTLVRLIRNMDLRRAVKDMLRTYRDG